MARRSLRSALIRRPHMQPKAPELRVPFWIGADGQPRDALTLAELGNSFKVIFCFKAMCPGCHSVGFPTMKTIYDGLKDKGIGMAVIHTAFDDDPRNSQDKVAEMQTKYDLPIPFGHDPKVGDKYPTFMQDYRTRGTPFFIILDPENKIIFSDFRPDAAKVVEVLGKA